MDRYYQYCMNGITGAKVIEGCKQNNISCHELKFSLFGVYVADEFPEKLQLLLKQCQPY